MAKLYTNYELADGSTLQIRRKRFPIGSYPIVWELVRTYPQPGIEPDCESFDNIADCEDSLLDLLESDLMDSLDIC